MRWITGTLAVVAGLVTFHAAAKPPPARSKSHAPKPPKRNAPRPPPVRPARPLELLPHVARVRVDVARDRVIVTEDVGLPRGEWQSGDMDFYVAFGAPGPPKAFDAHLFAVPAGEIEPWAEDPGEHLAVDLAPRRPISASLLLGRPHMAGVVVHVKEAGFRRALEPSDRAILRLRHLIDAPVADAEGGHEVIVRLGIVGGLPLTLYRLELSSLEPRPWLVRAEARLCGPHADPFPLSLAVVSPASGPPPAPWSHVAPVLAPRHADDDLCIRYWTR